MRTQNITSPGDGADHGRSKRMGDSTTRVAAGVLVAIFAIAGCGAKGIVESGAHSAPAPAPAPATAPAPSPTASSPAAPVADSCELITEGEAGVVLGAGLTTVESPLPDGGHWCAWRYAGTASLTQLELTTASGEDRFDEAMGRAERGGGLHDTDPALGELGFTTDDGQNRTVAWVIEDRSVVLTLTAGDASVEDLVVLAKAIDARLRA
jgi:hypothetical protein